MKQIKKIVRVFLQPFQSENVFNVGLILIFLLINGIVFVNASLHDPRIGYDATQHIRYIKTLSLLQLVRPEDSSEFFSPPLPYVFPALLVSLTGMKVLLAAKMSQYLNFFLSVGSTWYLIKVCHLINPKSTLKLGALVFLGILPVYYKTFAFVRGEPYVVFFVVVMVYYILKISIKEQYTLANGTALGITMGLCALSRQWGFFLFPSIFLFLIYKWFCLPRWRKSIAKILCLCSVLIIVINGWFYISLNLRYGSITAFNRESKAQFAFNNQPWKFYRGVNPKALVNNPVRPNFPNQLIPIFYSEMWGDYWGYFSIYGIDTRTPKFLNGYEIQEVLSEGRRRDFRNASEVIEVLSEGGQPDWLKTNYETFSAYLGRVNIVSIFPSVLIPVSFVFALITILIKSNNSQVSIYQKEFYTFLLLTIFTICAGYLWFLIMYPNLGKGDTIKASYLLHVFPLAAILVGVFLEYINKKSKYFFGMIIGGLALVFVHNFLAMITHYQLYLLN